jgi:pyocin large subunit-like protein
LPGNSASRTLIFALVLALPASGGGPGFRTQHLLQEHYARHGKDFGSISVEQYLHMAQQLRDARPGKNVLESKRPTGGGAKFDRRRGWYVAYDSDGTIRTFFVPKEGIHFFERQARTAAPPE